MRALWAIAVSLALHLAALWLLVPTFTRVSQRPVPVEKANMLPMLVVPAKAAPQTKPPLPKPPLPKPSLAKPHVKKTRASPPKNSAPIQPSRKPDPSAPDPPAPDPPAPAAAQPSSASLAEPALADDYAAPAAPQPSTAFMNAPAAPSEQEWAQAASYTLKNSKRYRHTWSQQLRSMMGTAHEGPEQGAVRFRVEIAPNGILARLDTLWSTSESVELRARKAMQNMPPLPPTPTGQPLIFEKTIVFDAFTAESPPLYKDDCEPDPPQHGNRFVWDGRSPQVVAPVAEAKRLDPVAYAECLKQLPQDSIEAEAASNERQLKQGASPKLGR